MSGRVTNTYGLKAAMKEDEWDIDFDDSREFLIEAWKNANELHDLTKTDREQSNDFTSHQVFSDWVYKARENAKKSGSALRSNMLLVIVQFVRWLWNFEMLIQELVVENHDSKDDVVEVKTIDTSALWRLAYLNVKLSVDSPSKLSKTHRWMNELRRNLELLVNAVRSSMELNTNADNSIRIEIMGVVEPLIALLRHSILYLQRNYDETDFSANYSSSMDPRIRETSEALNMTIKHLREVTNNSRVNHVQESSYAAEVGVLRQRVEQMDGSEKAIFPLELLPPFRTDHFTGRDKDIEKIHAWLGVRENPPIRTYTIYGRRGIGKTQIALEYAKRYKKDYDAIFWIQSETKAALRQSFTDVALALELEGADNNTTFDENLMRVLRWLRHTQKRWLLIYDNAEREQQLKGYWPSGGHGAMLLTSRSFHNFFEDENRHGETVQLFTDQERRNLLLALLGDEWVGRHLDPEDMMHEIEEAAIAALMKKTGGLPIAIRHAATQIRDPEINETGTVRAYMELFNMSFHTLPPRQTTIRDPLIQSLDTVWNIAFKNLETPAKNILSGISLLAPDSLLLDLFLPSDQRMLTDKLGFCRTSGVSANTTVPGPSIQTVVNPSSRLSEALDELQRKGLIKRTGRQISMHRTVQEAVNYQGKEELTQFYDAMVCLLYDAFPKQQDGRPLTEAWYWCRIWIQHVVTLAYKYRLYASNRPADDFPLKGMASAPYFVRLLANAAWYLFEIADYDEALTLINIARNAAQDKDSLTYAHLLNTEGTTYYEQNILGKARDALEGALAIRTRLLPEGDMEIANTLSNLGNIEMAEGNLDAAMEYVEKARHIREAIGDNAAMMLAISYMQVGRIHYLREEYTEAYSKYQKCEGVLNKKVGSNKSFMAHLYYAYGNLEFAQGDVVSAAKSFELTRQISKDFNPMHPLTAAACYKIACCEFEQDHHKKAISFLNKAQDIAEVNSGGVIDGTIARITWKRAEVMLDDPLGDRTAGNNIMTDIQWQQKEIAERMQVDLRGLDAMEDREKSFDLLVTGYFR